MSMLFVWYITCTFFSYICNHKLYKYLLTTPFVCSHKSLVGLCMLMKYFSRHIFVNQHENLWTKGLGGPM
ncbi:hypothetical protein VIGAN_11096100 [Vigna angularis var. angularis]|uniref:Uncharacterized protein n=1 Tax=Vigna angularis var. angularis TaxID=157739 RepID=A0A0S3T8Z8_PHAAN|nr:hypothetical protein VIGAN_11096100 [Vigna angularis var. angularis]